MLAHLVYSRIDILNRFDMVTVELHTCIFCFRTYLMVNYYYSEYVNQTADTNLYVLHKYNL